MIGQGLLSAPQTTVDHSKLLAIYREFYDKVEFPEYKPDFQDEQLWQLFKAKVFAIQREMLESGEVRKTKLGLMLWKPTPNTTHISNDNQPVPISTSPMTEKPSSNQDFHALESWQSMDGAAQARQFYLMLHTAKDPESVFHHCEQFCTDFRRKALRTATVSSPLEDHVQPRRSVSGPVSSEVRSTATPPAPQTPRVTTDLKTLLENRLREASVKRQRAKEEAEIVAGTAKRVKSEPT